jgi:uncharacterized circularly permuted ATP-grasp superfamily protein
LARSRRKQGSASPLHGVLSDGYSLDGFYDEAFEAGPRGVVPRRHYAELMRHITRMDAADVRRAAELANRSFLHRGVTFTVYSDGERRSERILPFDPIPRIVAADEWAVVEAGLRQRIRALNLFVHDVYHGQEILRDGVVPRRLVVLGRHFRREVVGIDVFHDQYLHVVGSDLIRDADGRWLVLEDNLRTPSGVSYVLANRQIMTRIFPDWFADLGVRPVDNYAGRLLDNLVGLSPRRAIPGAASGPAVVVLTPGIYNSAYFEHAFLAQQMGVDLVEGRDLFVLDNRVYTRTTFGRRQVDVIYRRVDDEFLDSLAFRPDSLLGVAGLLGAVRTGNVTLANAIGTGIADDKVLYHYVPAIIRYYLGEEPILGNVPTYLPFDPEQSEYVLQNLGSLVVKAANESGGYGMMIGPQAEEKEIEKFRRLIKANPRNYIAQPMIPISRHPTFVPDDGEGGRLEGRHVDLRPYAISGSDGITVLPGGLTRVALTRGSLVVNSSQGGGSKDTWVLQ